MDGSRSPSGLGDDLGLSLRRLRPDRRPGRRPRLSRIRVRLRDGAGTTLHVLSFERASARPRVVVFDRPLPLVRWCEENGVRNALVGGFFVRPEHAPLGELRLTGAPAPSVPFDAPWSGLRACVHIDESGLRIEPRDRIEPDPSGDLLQAGPLLVAGGRRTVRDDEDSEGFSAGAHQFDSDITAGRYPRAALAVSRDGGGSASLVHQGRLRNRPREAHGVDLLGGRPVVTAIVFAPV